jgi:hypothetical protein
MLMMHKKVTNYLIVTNLSGKNSDIFLHYPSMKGENIFALRKRLLWK